MDFTKGRGLIYIAGLVAAGVYPNPVQIAIDNVRIVQK
mgnify:CR=1 FL=1